jgi:hypothetical protein
MKNYGLTSVATFLGDNIVYRNLAPLDRRLPTFADIASRLELSSQSTPRKSERDYARVMAALLRQARALDGSAAAIERLIYVGDTRLNDGTAFANLCAAGAWPGLAFICAENAQPPAVQVSAATDDATVDATLYLVNRWAMSADFDQYCQKNGFPIDASTAVVLDLDKTTLGARGRNDHLINAARLEAVHQTVQTLLGDAFDPDSFKNTYDLFNDTAFHPFTTDNQDYLAYLCLILGSELFAVDQLAKDIRSGRLQSFIEWMDEVEVRAHDLPESRRTLHDDIYARVQAGDPTPFKAFRYNEYRTTVGRMGQLAPDAAAAALLDQEIVLTQEVREIALTWRSQGALLFGLSDKPDEASIPTPTLAAEGYEPIHRTPTHAVGDDTWLAPSGLAHGAAKPVGGMP